VKFEITFNQEPLYIFMSPARPIYDGLAARYDRVLAPFERRFIARWRKETLADLPADALLLEIGAGTGLNFSHYPPGIRRTVATDVSGAMLAEAQKKIRHKPSSETPPFLVCNRAEQLPFADNVFDAACATHVFCSVVSPQLVFAELQRVIKNGGTLVLLEHVRPRGILLGPLFDALSLITVPLFEDHFNRRTEQTAKTSGLQIMRAESRARGIVQMLVCRVEK
jgi:ubiquinone/menaquinone biosynthesis C-methylase UbiE